MARKHSWQRAFGLACITLPLGVIFAIGGFRYLVFTMDESGPPTILDLFFNPASFFAGFFVLIVGIMAIINAYVRFMTRRERFDASL